MAADAPIVEKPQSPQEAALDPTRYLPVGHDFQSITEKIGALVLERPTQRVWLAGVGAGTILLLILAAVVTYLLMKGVGIWGINVPVGWCFAITSFVWWIGIGHAGTLISAILLLLHQKWRTSINRIAEAMTIFAVMCAGTVSAPAPGTPVVLLLAPALSEHDAAVAAVPQCAGVGRVCRQHVFHGVADVLVHGHDSRLGHAPRPGRAAALADVVWILALGWRNSAKHWHRYEMAYLLLGGLATPLVISVHSVVSSDFAISVEPGWHETVFPPYFVAGALLSGFAMVIAICIPHAALLRGTGFHLDQSSRGDGQDSPGDELLHVLRLFQRAGDHVDCRRGSGQIRLLEHPGRFPAVRGDHLDHARLRVHRTAIALDSTIPPK